MASTFPAVSLFSNCGAGDLGYAHSGFRFRILAELESRRLDVASLNHPNAQTILGDLRSTWPQVISAYKAKSHTARLALLSACPPCQGMSTARADRGLESDADAGSRDYRNLLVEVIASVAAGLQPRIVVVENVQAFLTRRVRHPDNGSPVSAANLLADRLNDHYAMFPMRSDLADFGIPQHRRRSFLVFIHREEPGLERLAVTNTTPFPAASHGPGLQEDHITIEQSLGELTKSSSYPLTPDVRLAIDKLHMTRPLSRRTSFMVSSIPSGSGKSAWQNTICETCGPMEVSPEDATCRKCGGPLARPVVLEDGEWRLVRGFRNSSYRRMDPRKPAATITTAAGRISSDNTIHPFENRVLTPLESQHLQTFPAEFKWGSQLNEDSDAPIREMIGEAVPPKFTALHGRILASILGGHAPQGAMPDSDRRILTARELLDR